MTSQFTATAFTYLMKDNAIAISMDGKGAWRDNAFVERLWRSVKYEEVYLHAYDTVSDAREAIGSYFAFYNSRRPYSSPDRQTPDQTYFPGYRNPRLPEPARAATYRTRNAVQTNRATSMSRWRSTRSAASGLGLTVLRPRRAGTSAPKAPASRCRRHSVRADE